MEGRERFGAGATGGPSFRTTATASMSSDGFSGVGSEETHAHYGGGGGGGGGGEAVRGVGSGDSGDGPRPFSSPAPPIAEESAYYGGAGAASAYGGGGGGVERGYASGSVAAGSGVTTEDAVRGGGFYGGSGADEGIRIGTGPPPPGRRWSDELPPVAGRRNSGGGGGRGWTDVDDDGGGKMPAGAGEEGGYSSAGGYSSGYASGGGYSEPPLAAPRRRASGEHSSAAYTAPPYSEPFARRASGEHARRTSGEHYRRPSGEHSYSVGGGGGYSAAMYSSAAFARRGSGEHARRTSGEHSSSSRQPYHRTSSGLMSGSGGGYSEPTPVMRNTAAMGAAASAGPTINRLSATEGMAQFESGRFHSSGGDLGHHDDGVTVLSMGSVGEKIEREMRRHQAMAYARERQDMEQMEAWTEEEEESKMNPDDPLGESERPGSVAASAAASAAMAGGSVAGSVAGSEGMKSRASRDGSKAPLDGGGMRPALRQPWVQSQSKRDLRLQMPSTVEVDVFATPYEPDHDLPTGFAERRLQEEQARLREWRNQPVHTQLPEDHPDRDDTGFAKRYYLTPDQVALLDEEAAMTPRAIKMNKLCTCIGVLGMAAAAAYAAIAVNDLQMDPDHTERIAKLADDGKEYMNGALETAAGYTPLGTNWNGAGQPGAKNVGARSQDPGVLMSGAATSTSSDSRAQIALPSVLDAALKDIANLYSNDGSEVPLFWHVPLTGGNGVEGAFGECLGLVQASELGCRTGMCGEDQPLQIVEVYGESYVNVDLTDPPGIARANALGLGTHPVLADVVYSPHLHPASLLFIHDDANAAVLPRGRMFALFRHPVDRALSTYFYVRDSETKPEDFPENIAEYATSSYVENNLLTRLLVDKRHGTLEEADVRVAQEVLRRKCLVGLYDDAHESVRRYRSYFGFNANGGGGAPSIQDECVTTEVQAVLDRTGGFPRPSEESAVYKSLADQNKWDMLVYRYAEELYEHQGYVLFGVAREQQPQPSGR